MSHVPLERITPLSDTASALTLAVVDYGIGNLRSAEKGLQFVGANARLCENPDEVVNADAVVLPGVGAYGSCVSALQNSGMSEALGEVVHRSIPLLGVCVGMQLLFSSSEESPRAVGLGLVDGAVRRLVGAPRLPHMQWNQLAPFVDNTSATDITREYFWRNLGEDPWMYFVHSFAADCGPSTIAQSSYPTPFCAAIATDTLWATQFHPEKSAGIGEQILKNFLSL